MTVINDKKAIEEVLNLNLSSIIEDLFMVLTHKEKDVVIKRFSLDNKPKLTLEKIGQAFSVTRERVRQIEKIALGKLRRTVETTKLSILNKLAKEILMENGGVTLETKLISELVRRINSVEPTDANIIRLALKVNADLVECEKNNVFKTFWKLSFVSMEDIKSIVALGVDVLKKNGDLLTEDQLYRNLSEMALDKGKRYDKSLVLSALEVDRQVKRTSEGFGLVFWRHINPRSIRDKAYIVLKRANEPLHFVEIANRIASSGFDKKVVTTQAVHNELIRYEQFVLVGRGLYALKEWGFKKGTVAEVIENLLKKKAPLTKQEIIAGVLRQRKVKKGTISLNLQKNPQFVRVGRAVYTLDESLKTA